MLLSSGNFEGDAHGCTDLTFTPPFAPFNHRPPTFGSPPSGVPSLTEGLNAQWFQGR